jgi:hypothetical protein
MATPALEGVQLPMGYCITCAREVMVYLDVAEGDREQRRCLHCDAGLEEWRDAGPEEVEAAGYTLVEARGCGNGGGCSSGCGMRR